jgi:predicted DNA-binding transcriptional regulator AlpA
MRRLPTHERLPLQMESTERCPLPSPLTPAQALSLVTEALSELVQLVPVLTAILTDVRSEAPQKAPTEHSEASDDRALSAAEAAAMIGVSPQWLYRHTRTLPFVRKLSRKKTVYSEAGIRRWLAMRRTAA